MGLAPTAIERIIEFIDREVKELPRTDYIDVLEDIKDEVEMMLDAAQEDEAREERVRVEAVIEGEEQG